MAAVIHLTGPSVQASRTGDASRVVVGTLAGTALGAIARLWMRLISDVPEFTWSGTIFIVAGFTIFGFAQSVAALARRRGWRPWLARAVRCVGVVGMLPLFVGAGAPMMPTVVGGGLAAWRHDWPKAARVVCLVLASLPIVVVGSQVVGDFGWSLHAFVGIVAMLAVYGAIVWATKATLVRPADPWPMRRLAIVAVIALVLVLLARVGVRST